MALRGGPGRAGRTSDHCVAWSRRGGHCASSGAGGPAPACLTTNAVAASSGHQPTTNEGNIVLRVPRVPHTIYTTNGAIEGTRNKILRKLQNTKTIRLQTQYGTPQYITLEIFNNIYIIYTLPLDLCRLAPIGS